MNASAILGRGNMNMPSYKFVVLTNAIEDQDDVFNEWYDKQHLADLLAIPGFENAHRYRVIGAGDTKPQWRYLAIYEIETDDIEATIAEMYARSGTGTMPLSPALDMATVYAMPFEPIG